MDKCDIWGTVDFGQGPVEVRCTELGEHLQHRCVVFLNDIPEIQHQNVFKKKD